MPVTAAMTQLERFRAVMNFQPVDRLPRLEWAVWWNLTVERWHSEGLPSFMDRLRPIDTPFDWYCPERYEMYRHFGLDVYYQHWFMPRAGTLPHPARHGGPIVASMDDYDRLKEHLFPPVDAVIDRMEGWAGEQRRGEAVVWISLDGFFWFPRTLLGIEEHLFAFYTQPELMQRMNADLLQYNIHVLEELARRDCLPAMVVLGEDMSYNLGPMIGKNLFDEFLAPYYRPLVALIRELGIVPFVDSDGDVTGMVPWLTEVGVQGVLPLERQAHVDANLLRQQYPGFCMIGHFDKLVMDKGEGAIRAEFERLLPAMRSGGFIPSVDHQTPPAVSLAQYGDYLRLLKEYTELAAR
jgi:hypothetical protein